MSEQVNPVPAEEREASGLLLSVEPLNEGTRLSATDTVDGGADAGGDTDTTDRGDADGTDIIGDTDGTDTTSDTDGSDVVEKVKDALGMDDSDADSDGTDTVDADGTDGR